MSMAFLSAGQGTWRTLPAPATSISSRTRSECDVGSLPPTLKTWPFTLSDAPAREEAHRANPHKTEGGDRRSVPKDRNLAPFEPQPDKPADKSLAVVLDEL